MARRKRKPQTLTDALSRLLQRVLLPDLQARAERPAVERALRARHTDEIDAKRTAASFDDWREQVLEQVGAAWILSAVFIRVLEDRELLDRDGRRRIAGPGAADSEQLFFELCPNLTARDYLLTVFKEVSGLPGAEDLLGPAKNPAWRLSPSNDAARALLDVLRERDDDGALRYTFTRGDDDDRDQSAHGDTRFLGDLYQDLSESVRKRYALLQTPDFVESFVLERTLDPAIDEYGLDTVRVIDPTCGSGHFLLGAFDRLIDARLRARPGGDVKAHALAALNQVYGVDVNPYAVAIARFRLTLAYVDATATTRLADVPRLPLNLVVGDSLLHGARQGDLAETTDDPRWGAALFDLEDAAEARRVLGRRYHVVVGNPPYITCKDKAQRDTYREMYVACYGSYALAAPFTERFFQLASDGGFVGEIVANSFMKRTFGTKLVEEVLPHVDLFEVVDASGAYIPGHGTPTVLLFGRNRPPTSDTLIAVQGKRGEPTTPDDPAQGEVWSTIRDHDREIDFENEYLSVDEVPRARLAQHPWTLKGGGASRLKGLLEERAGRTLASVIDPGIGRAVRTGEDEAFTRPKHVVRRLPIAADHWRLLLRGEDIRDWSASPSEFVWFPYVPEQSLQAPEADAEDWQRDLDEFWRYRELLRERTTFSGKMEDAGLHWFEYQQYTKSAHETPLSIAFAFVATHNHFVLDRGGKVFNRSAPIIKLPEGATEEEHLALLGYLNSSTACFWMKQVFHPKSNPSQKHHPHPARVAFEFAGTGLQELPIPELSTVKDLSARADQIAQERAQRLSADRLEKLIQTCRSRAELKQVLAKRWVEADDFRRQMIAIQEEIDWRVYESFGLASDVSLPDHRTEGLRVARGQRAFEHLKGRESTVRRAGRMLSLSEAEVETAPSEALRNDIETCWKQRESTIRNTKAIRLIETMQFKRLWRDTEVNESEREYRASKDRDDVEAWLLRQFEELISSSSSTVSAHQVTGALLATPSVAACVAWLEPEADPQDVVTRLVESDAVPFLSQATFRDSGLRKHAGWQRTWELQRREDAGDDVGDIPVPPKYKSKDYASSTYWRLRGKLDVPKERFISYPGCERDEDPSPLIGWAGWSDLQRAQALAGLYQTRKIDDGWGAERLKPLLAGLSELVPWLKQWHNEPDPAYDGERLGDYFERFVEAEARALGLA